MMVRKGCSNSRPLVYHITLSTVFWQTVVYEGGGGLIDPPFFCPISGLTKILNIAFKSYLEPILIPACTPKNVSNTLNWPSEIVIK